jgi:hypothetical protein
VLRGNGWISRWWKPKIHVVHIKGESGEVIKYVHRKRIVAIWDKTRHTFAVKKPYDLVIHDPEKKNE